MTTREKLEKEVKDKIDSLNSTILVNKKWKLGFVNRGTNDYCLTIVCGNEELFSGKFATYGSVFSCLDLLTFMFSRALNDRIGENLNEK